MILLGRREDLAPLHEGNLTARTDNDEIFTEKFCYDSLNRLTNYRIGSACTGSGGKTVAYDSIGNITVVNSGDILLN